MKTEDALALNGRVVTDVITGFSGRVTGICVYLAGCHQALVWPQVKEGGKMTEGTWLDCALRVNENHEPLLLEEEVTGGDGPSAPAR